MGEYVTDGEHLFEVVDRRTVKSTNQYKKDAHFVLLENSRSGYHMEITEEEFSKFKPVEPETPEPTPEDLTDLDTWSTEPPVWLT